MRNSLKRDCQIFPASARPIMLPSMRKVTVTALVMGGVVAELRHPRGDDGVEEATVRVVYPWVGAEVEGATHVDGSGDHAIGDVVKATGVRLAGVEDSGLAFSNRDAELVGMSPPRGSPAGFALQVRAVTMKPTLTWWSPYLRRLESISRNWTIRIALKFLTRSIYAKTKRLCVRV